MILLLFGLTPAASVAAPTGRVAAAVVPAELAA